TLQRAITSIRDFSDDLKAGKNNVDRLDNPFREFESKLKDRAPLLVRQDSDSIEDRNTTHREVVPVSNNMLSATGKTDDVVKKELVITINPRLNNFSLMKRDDFNKLDLLKSKVQRIYIKNSDRIS